ncbi:uncharacterized protein F5147DRAFT_690682 [Suillus discolor]|uniref:Uncharacterized protein n=1 Tax=Suillus discolor TaxID=1912936 RepID=A0A9P7F944_9AGAM|nr:uncharacterized protein F5147DRAFT_690682 [Suillus discolor]KAG2109878.1 hypothetical protein F5147DRAFT_690682 [Suillus discolor]
MAAVLLHIIAHFVFFCLSSHLYICSHSLSPFLFLLQFFLVHRTHPRSYSTRISQRPCDDVKNIDISHGHAYNAYIN